MRNLRCIRTGALAVSGRGRVWPGALLSVALGIGGTLTAAQSPAPGASSAPAGVRQLGTVKSIAGSTVMLGTDAGKTVTVTVTDGARVLQLAPGSTDLKTAQVIALSGISVGDRVLVTGRPGTGEDTVTATRVILMKGADIAEKRATEQQEWRRNGTSGVLGAVDGTTLTVVTGTKKLMVTTTPGTVYRSYAGDSVKYQDAKPGTAQQLQAGDQISVRGLNPASDDSITAVEIVSGSFKNLSGVITAVDASTGAVSFKDLATKQPVKVLVTANSDLRRLPPEAAARFAARTRGNAAGGTGIPAGGVPAGGAPAAGGGGSGAGAGAGGPGGPGGRSAGMDLSRMLERLPPETVAEVKVGEAVMVVASSRAGGDYTAVTMLSGVEQILAAAPSGSSGAVTLSPWTLGAPEGGGGQ